MSEFAIIFQVVLGLLAVFFIFLTYMNTKTWRWVHVTFMFLVFGAAVAFMAFAAMSLKTRTAWLAVVERLETNLTSTEERNEQLNTGSLLDESSKSVLKLQDELNRTIIDRGRVWRHVNPQINADNTVTVAIVADPGAVPPVPGVDPAAAPAPAAAPQKHNIEAKTVVHAFKEMPNTAGIAVPRFYLGEFQAVNVTDTSITLAPTLPLGPDQAAQVRNVDSTWALYESSPVDNHEVFAGLSEAELQALIPASPGVSPDRYNKMIQEYVRDGQQALDTDPPERVWIEVQFTQPHSVVVDAVQAVDTVDGAPFDNGLALRSRLRRGEEAGPVQFKPNDTAIFNKAKADELISQGVAKQVKPIYRRRLHDYEFEFHSLYRRMVALNNRGRDLTRDINTLKAAIAKADEQIKMNEAEVAALQADVDKATYERDQLKAYAGKLTARVDEVKGDLSRLYVSNRALSRELATISAELMEAADRRTREATAQVQ